MKRPNLTAMTVEELVERFIAIAHEQAQAELEDDHRQGRTLYWKMEAVEEELKRRQGDQRRALLPLLSNSNLQVAMKAALSVLAFAPKEGRAVLQAITDLRWPPQALEAGMALWDLDRGVFKPK